MSCVPEVFNICPGGGYTLTSDEAAATCQAAGARLATPDEITQAQKLGANWCACGWASDGNAYYPMNKVLPEYGGGCGDPNNMGVRSCGQVSWSGGKACATCFGVKPKASTNPPGVLTFNSDQQQVNTYRMTSPGYDETSGAGQICFDGLTVAQAQAQCSANPDCKSFSFVAGQVGVPMDVGGGCYKMDHVGFNPNPAYVGFTKVLSTTTSASTWNAPLIPQIGNLFTFKNAGNTQGMFHHEGVNTMMVGSSITPGNSTFQIVASNNSKDGYISLMSYDTPNSHIRHSGFVAYLNEKDGTDMFNNDSSFLVIPALNGKPNMFSLQSYNYPDHYLMCNPNNPDQIVLQIPGASTSFASWYGIIPQILTQ